MQFSALTSRLFTCSLFARKFASALLHISVVLYLSMSLSPLPLRNVETDSPSHIWRFRKCFSLFSIKASYFYCGSCGLASGGVELSWGGGHMADFHKVLKFCREISGFPYTSCIICSWTLRWVLYGFCVLESLWRWHLWDWLPFHSSKQIPYLAFAIFERLEADWPVPVMARRTLERGTVKSPWNHNSGDCETARLEMHW
jgi:hypothetical protein